MIYIIIPVHNRKQYTQQCLACLKVQTEQAHRILVVDDGSTDGTADLIRDEFPDVVVLTGTGSLWWAGATNLGIRYVLDQLTSQPNDFLLMLNDDTEVPPDYLENLLTAYQANQPCIIGSVSVDLRQPSRLLYAGTHIDLSFAQLRDLAQTRYRQQLERLSIGPLYIPSDCLPGRGMLVPISVFSKIGLLDEVHFQHHMADIDFSIRAKKAGFSLFVATRCIVYEHAEATGLRLNQSTSLRHFWVALFVTRSPINLKIRYHFARIHAPVFPIYLLFDLSRILGGYIRRKLMKH